MSRSNKRRHPLSRLAPRTNCPSSRCAQIAKSSRGGILRSVLVGLGLVAAVGATGCQVDVGGQTLPSPYYMSDDVQYFAPGAEFKLAREAAAMKAASQEQELMQR